MTDTAPPSRWLAVVGGALLLGGLAFIVRANIGTEPNPCGDTERVHPLTKACVAASEFCERTFSSDLAGTGTCSAHSADGSAYIEIELKGTGDANVHLRDGTGQNVLNERYRLTYGLHATLKGAPGDWTLDADFRRAQGDGFVRIWG